MNTQGDALGATSVSTSAIIPDFSVILICWNDKDYLEPCLNSLYSGKIRFFFDVVVVDNGSTDGSQEMLKDKYPEVTIIQNEQNIGYGKACNQGIIATQGRYVLLLNNDTIVNGSSLDALVNFLDTHSDTAVVGGQLLNPDGSVQSCYNHFPSLVEEFLIATRLGELLVRKWYPSIICDTEVRSVNWMGSACLLLKREALDQVGLLDEDYFIYSDETDLQYRLKSAGWKVYYLPNVTTVHYGGGSMDRWRRRKMVYRGKMLFFRKNYGSQRTWALRVMLAVLSLGKMVVWATLFVFPQRRDLARKELHSNFEVLKLCWKLT